LICMDAGRIIADGDPRAVMADSAVIAAYLGGSVH
jgi:branched-chain amino acid transport system ATP-binding protein